jgi:L-rhamnose mutarotase
MKIYLLEAPMFMDVDEHFSSERKGRSGPDNPKVREWEQLTWKYQQAYQKQSGRKKMLMQRIFL